MKFSAMVTRRSEKAIRSKIISKTCDAIEKQRKMVRNKFEELWMVPHVIGCVDSKHVKIECPKLSETFYYNYTDFFSMVT